MIDLFNENGIIHVWGKPGAGKTRFAINFLASTGKLPFIIIASKTKEIKLLLRKIGLQHEVILLKHTSIDDLKDFFKKLLNGYKIDHEAVLVDNINEWYKLNPTPRMKKEMEELMGLIWKYNLNLEKSVVFTSLVGKNGLPLLNDLFKCFETSRILVSRQISITKVIPNMKRRLTGILNEKILEGT